MACTGKIFPVPGAVRRPYITQLCEMLETAGRRLCLSDMYKC